jgi:hypothetical protein
MIPKRLHFVKDSNPDLLGCDVVGYRPVTKPKATLRLRCVPGPENSRYKVIDPLIPVYSRSAITDTKFCLDQAQYEGKQQMELNFIISFDKSRSQ